MCVVLFRIVDKWNNYFTLSIENRADNHLILVGINSSHFGLLGKTSAVLDF